MKWIFALALFLLSTLSAQAQVFNLQQLGLGVIVPFTVELDGNPNTVEWATYDENFEKIYIIAPNGCKQVVSMTPIAYPGNTAVWWHLEFRRIGAIDQLLVVDLDNRDGVTPMQIQPIRQTCYATR